MNRDINEAIDGAIDHYKKANLPSDSTERDRYYLIQGLEIAKVMVDGVEEVNTTALAYEKFEELVKIFKNILSESEFSQIIHGTEEV